MSACDKVNFLKASPLPVLPPAARVRTVSVVLLSYLGFRFYQYRIARVGGEFAAAESYNESV
jgi:hypothetical protein